MTRVPLATLTCALGCATSTPVPPLITPETKLVVPEPPSLLYTELANESDGKDPQGLELQAQPSPKALPWT